MPTPQCRLQLFVGPLCDAGSPPTVVADSTDQVDDYDRNNNAIFRSPSDPGDR